jgi:hypothetical protein
MNNNRLKSFSPLNPVGDAPGMEPVNIKLLEAVVANIAPRPEPMPTPAPAAMSTTIPSQAPTIQRINKNIRLPADLVDFIDFEYARANRMKQQDAYTHALEAFFRPLMEKHKQGR